MNGGRARVKVIGANVICDEESGEGADRRQIKTRMTGARPTYLGPKTADQTALIPTYLSLYHLSLSLSLPLSLSLSLSLSLPLSLSLLSLSLSIFHSISQYSVSLPLFDIIHQIF